jgi:DnaJ family protein C protein 17
MENKDLDYYALLEIEITSTSKEIERAYRKKALKVHPDKNPSPDAGNKNSVMLYLTLFINF